MRLFLVRGRHVRRHGARDRADIGGGREGVDELLDGYRVVTGLALTGNRCPSGPFPVHKADRACRGGRGPIAGVAAFCGDR